MGKGSRNRKHRRVQTNLGSAERVAQRALRPEYPSLTAAEIAEGAASRLARSRRKFLGSRPAKPIDHPSVETYVGKFGEFEHASTADVDEWMQGWRMCSSVSGPDVLSSAAVFVGLEQSLEMPHVSSLRNGAPFVTITSQFIDTCVRMSEIFPVFAQMTHRTPNVHEGSAARGILFQHLDFEESDSAVDELLRASGDELFTRRATAAAVRWAIAHEMAHVVASKKDRQAAYAQLVAGWPKMEASWSELRNELPDYQGSIELYRDEIACDFLAMQYIYHSPFAVDDLMTQVSGSLLALEALIWDGWLQDGSAVSQTHPSPSLRFMLVWHGWFDLIMRLDTWHTRRPPSPLGLKDFAYWYAFERWAAGEYGATRSGAAWNEDIQLIESVLLARGNPIAADEIYALRSEKIYRLSVREPDPT